MKENNAVGLSFLGLLTIVFIVLKLTGVIAWSWWFVLLPFWGPLAIERGLLMDKLDIGCLWVVVCGFGVTIYQDITFLAVFWLVAMVVRIFILLYNLFFYFREE